MECGGKQLVRRSLWRRRKRDAAFLIFDLPVLPELSCIQRGSGNFLLISPPVSRIYGLRPKFRLYLVQLVIQPYSLKLSIDRLSVSHIVSPLVRFIKRINRS